MDIKTTPRFIYPQNKPHASGRLAVIDLGSSMVRLVVYGNGLYPHLYLNHKAWTALAKGKEVGEDFFLKEDAMERTLNAIDWFLWVCKQADVTRVICTATSAVREAVNGEDFVERVKQSCGLHVEIISGEYEARLSAAGAIVSIPDAEGIVIDLGGGSLDICETKLDGDFTSLPLGVLSLQAMSGNNPKKAVEILRQSLRKVEWFKTCKKTDLVALGAGMRSLASLHMAEVNYPMRILHDYVLDRRQALDFCEQFLNGQISSRIAEMAKDYMDVLPYRAAALYALLEEMQFEDVRFATFGLREGVLFSELSEDVMHGDPLLTFAVDMAERDGRGRDYALIMANWVHHYFPEIEPRILQVSAMFADISWREQATYRATTAFETVYGGSYVACSHKDRARLALISYFSHERMLEEFLTKRFPPSLTVEDVNEAKLVGALFALARMLDPGARGMLDEFSLEKMQNGQLNLKGPVSFMRMESETVAKKLEYINSLLNNS